MKQLQDRIFEWWRQTGRVLPWRVKLTANQPEPASNSTDSLRDSAFASYFTTQTQRDPYRVILAEVMLQQTQVARVIEKYEAWLRRWPTMADLANSQLSEVLVEWQGLGYNRRAKYLWELARTITNDRKGVWPNTEAELLNLPGIGRYTARAVLVFAFGQQLGMVDTNIKRILERWNWDGGQTARNEREWFALADASLPTDLADPWGQALMDFGALICTSNRPKCLDCPVANLCRANQWAKDQGFANFSEWQISQIKKNAKDLTKKTKIPFRDTDRFFRGRIIDELRLKNQTLLTLAKTLEKEYGLADPARFHKLILALEKEGLIVAEQSQVRLA
jgi:A/G-specific adenine glycosylase